MEISKISTERTGMEEKNIKTNNAERITSEFNSFCWKVIRYSVLNQLRNYVRHCRIYKTVPLEEAQESVMAVCDEDQNEKVKIPVGGTVVFIENDKLAEALLGLQNKKREIILMNAVLGYSLSEIAGKLDLKYDTVKQYKYKAMKELRGKVGVNEK